jgi:hypothetical protein
MNTTYSISSSRFDGEVRVTYNPEKLLVKFEVIGSIEHKRMIQVLRLLPLTSDELNDLKKTSKTVVIQEVFEEITFDMMWKRYDDSDRSSKKKSLAKWAKMDVANQRKAYFFYAKYVRSLPPGVAKKYLTTYLNDELWNN